MRDGALVTGARRTSNLCLIRSGQDWGDTEADERRMYLRDVEPVLRAGMDFLRDEGRGSAASPTATCTVVETATAGRPRRATA